MTTASRLRALAGGCLLLAACTDPVDPADPPPPLDRTPPERSWRYTVYDVRDPGGLHTIDRDDRRAGGAVHDSTIFGVVTLAPDGSPLATGEVFSSPDGSTYWARAEKGDGEGSAVLLTQTQSFTKNRADATLELHLTALVLDVVRQGFEPPCPRSAGCQPAGLARAGITVTAYGDSVEHEYRSSYVYLSRIAGAWRPSVSHGARSILADADFDTTFTPSRGTVLLARTVTVPVDISRVPVGSDFGLMIEVDVGTESHVRDDGDGTGMYVAAYLRDPLGVGGATLSFRGLTPANRPLPRPPADGSLGRAPACNTPDPGAGTLRLAAPAFSQEESAFPEPDGVVVRRTGGTRGRASVTLRTSDGTAVAGRDYRPLAVTVTFADGDSTPRTIRVPVLPDTLVNGDRTLQVTLADLGGCATLGAASAAVTIMDDEVSPTPTFTVGGTVAGLTGSGLALRNANTGETLAVGNGAFTFAQRLPNAFNYAVAVATQPANPAQVCTVANGSGTVGGADVTNVAVTCLTPAPVGGLDPAFGTGGRVTTPIIGGRGEAVAVQPDGKILVAGRSSAGGGDFTVLRYNADGTPDATFGTAGVATAGFPAGRNDEAFDVAVQADGKIVLVGRTDGAGGAVDFGIARLDASGRLDAGFGTGGLVATDFAGLSDLAQAVAVQPDGKIVVAGHAGVNITDTDFALARYNADGTLDAGFGTGGKVTTNVAGRTDLAFAVALAPGGKIVVAGRAEQRDGRGDDFGLVRYDPNGTLDVGFGGGGIVTTDIAGGSQQANGVVVQPDGRIVVAGYTGRGTGNFDFALARYNADGTPDPGFGTAGAVATDLSGQDDFAEDLALRDDGKIVVIGRRTSGTFFDLALTRHLGNGGLDTSFGTAGKMEVDFFGDEDRGQAVAVQGDGKIVAAGYTRRGPASDFALVRVLP